MPQSKYVIIYSDGFAENVRDDRSQWYDILHDVAAAVNGGGSRQPEMLLKDGKVIVAKYLGQHAWRYQERLNKAQREARDRIRVDYPDPTAVGEKS